MGWLDDKIDDVQDSVDETVDTVEETAGDIVSGGQEAVDEVSEGAQDVADEVSQGDVGGAVDEATDTASDVGDTVQETAGNVVSGDQDSGSDAFSGGGSGSSDPDSSGGSGGSSYDPGDSSSGGSGNPTNPGIGNAGNTKNNTNKSGQEVSGSSVSTRSGSNTQGNQAGSTQKNTDKGPSGSQKPSKRDLFLQKVRGNRDQIENAVSNNYKDRRGSSGPKRTGDQPTPNQRLQNSILGASDQTSARRQLFQDYKQDSKENLKEFYGIKEPEIQEIDFGTIDDPEYYREQKLKDQADLTPGESSMLKTLATQSVLEESARKGGKELTGSKYGGYLAVGGQSVGTDPLLITEQATGIAQTIADEPSERLPRVPSGVSKGGQKIVDQAKENPVQFALEEAVFEVAGGVTGGSSITTTTSTKTPSNVNVDIQESYLPDLESAQGETLQQSRMKQGAGARNTGRETSAGRSVSKKTGDKVQSQGEQPSLYGKAEYEIDGKTKTEDFIGQVKSSSETQTSSKGQGPSKPFESQEFGFESEGTASIDLTKIGEDGKVGGDVVEDAGKKIIDSESQGQGQIDPLMYEADPDGGLKVGFESKQIETGKSGGESFGSESKSTGLKDLENDVTKKNTKTRSSSSRGRGKTSSKDLTVDSENLPDADKVRNQKYGNSDSSGSTDFKDLTDNQDVDPQDSSVLDEMIGDSDSSSSTDSSSRDSSSSNFDPSDYDGSGSSGQSSLVQKTPDQDSTSSGVDPKDAVDTSSRDAQSFEKAIKEKVSNREIDVQKDINVVGKSVGTGQDLDLDQGMDLDQDLGQGQKQDQGIEQKQPPVEEEINIQDSTLTGSSTSSPGRSSSFSFSSSTNTPGKTKTPDLDIGPEKKDGESFLEDDVLTGEKNRDYSASLDAVILGIKGGKKQYDLGTRPVQSSSSSSNSKKKVKIDSKDEELFTL